MENKFPKQRRFPRHRCSLPIQLRPAEQPYPTSSETTDVSLCGCYVKMLLPLPVGAVVDIRIGIGGGEVTAKGLVKTMDPALGNGIELTEMAPSCRLELQHYLQTLPEANPGASEIIR